MKLKDEYNVDKSEYKKLKENISKLDLELNTYEDSKRIYFIIDNNKIIFKYIYN